MKCPKCKRKFTVPENLMSGAMVTEAFVDGRYVTMCPLCYADDHLIRHGVKWNPKGEMAKEMFEEAKKQYPDWKEVEVQK